MVKTYECQECSFQVDEALRRCPLCGHDNPEVHEDEATYPYYGPAVRRRRRRSRLRVVNFVFPIVAIALVVTNLLATGNLSWVLDVIPLVLYLWFVLANGVLSDVRLPVRIVAQEYALAILLVVMDWRFGWHKWSVDYAIPMMFMVTCIVTSIVVAIGTAKIERGDFMGPVLAAIIGSAICVILYFTHVSSVLWPSSAALLVGLVLVTGLVVFRRKELGHYLRASFHY